MPQRQINNNGLRIVCFSEHCALVAYLDSALVPTIGWGHTAGVKLGMTCTQAEADEWKRQDCEEAAHYVSFYVKTVLTENQFSAVTSLVYNMGIGNFLQTSCFVHLRAGGLQKAADAMRLLTAEHQPSGRIDHPRGLILRRHNERKLFLTPDSEPFVLDEKLVQAF